jgi:very-short-patch-repair endonuclease
VAQNSGVLQRKTLARAHPDVRLAEIAEQQHGVISRRQLRAIGMSEEAIRHRVAVRRLHRVNSSVYAVGHRLTPHGHCLAGVLGYGERAFASHRWGAALLDLRRSPAGPVDVTTTRRGARSLPGVTVHETRCLAPDEHTVVDGIPCTSVARTLVDLAAIATTPELERALEQSMRLGLFDRNAIERLAGRRGIARLRTLMAHLPDEPAPTNRELERRFLSLVRGARLPLPVVNAYIGEHQVDFQWPAHRLVVETDGRATHDSPVAFQRDRRRDLDLELAGWHVLRLGWRQVLGDPERVAALLHTHLFTESRSAHVRRR